jgi:hypothetical protein
MADVVNATLATCLMAVKSVATLGWRVKAKSHPSKWLVFEGGD